MQQQNAAPAEKVQVVQDPFPKMEPKKQEPDITNESVTSDTDPISPRKVTRYNTGKCATLRTFFTSRIFLLISALMVIIATIISTVIKYIASSYSKKNNNADTQIELPDAAFAVVVLLMLTYLFLFIFFVFEYMAKLCSFGCKRFYYSSANGMLSNFLAK